MVGSRKRRRGEGTPVTSPYFQGVSAANGPFRCARTVPPGSKIRSENSRRIISSEMEIDENEDNETLRCALFAENKSDAVLDENGSTSDYFLRSPSSAYGSVRSLGQLVYTWITCSSRDEIRSKCSRRMPSSENNGKPCKSCSKVLTKDAFRHFRDCPVFQQKLKSYDVDSNHVNKRNCIPTCVEVVGWWVEKHALRHLCPNQCFLRAFAPNRDWLSLRRHLNNFTPMGGVLTDWTCRLAPEIKSDEGEISIPDRALPTFRSRRSNELEPVRKDPKIQQVRSTKEWNRHLPRTVFVSLKTGESFLSIQKAQKRILAENVRSKGAKSRVLIEQKSESLTFDENFYRENKSRAESPFGLIEELFPEDSWRVLISTMLLNKTQRKQNTDSILYHLFDRWPTADSVVKDAELDEEEIHLFVFALVRKAGLGQCKARAFVQLSRDYLLLLESKIQGSENSAAERVAFELTREDVKQLFNCGDYAADAYQVFIRKDFESPLLSNDQMLLAYVEWKRSLSCLVA